jgi:hypothetical protein
MAWHFYQLFLFFYLLVLQVHEIHHGRSQTEGCMVYYSAVFWIFGVVVTFFSRLSSISTYYPSKKWVGCLILRALVSSCCISVYLSVILSLLNTLVNEGTLWAGWVFLFLHGVRILSKRMSCTLFEDTYSTILLLW